MSNTINWKSVTKIISSEYIQITDNYIDNQYNIYISGSFSGEVDFGNGLINANGDDGFIIKYNADGLLIWSAFFTGKGSQIVSNIVVDSKNNVDIIGNFYDTLKINEVNIPSKGENDSYLAQINNENGELKWIKILSGLKSNVANKLGVDKDDNIIISGYYKDTLYFEGLNTICRSINNFDAFIAKINPNGDVKWLQKSGGEQFTNVFISGFSISLDKSISICGTYIGSPIFGSINKENAEYTTQYLAKLDSNGLFVKVKSIGENNGGDIISIVTNSSNDIFISGYFGYSFLQNAYIDTFKLTPLGPYSDWYVAKFDENWNFNWAKKGGSIPYQDIPTDMLVDNDGGVVVAGWIGGDKGVFDTDTIFSYGSQDVALVKYASNGTVQWVKGAGGVEEDEVSSISKVGNKYLASGYFTSQCSFDSILIYENSGVTGAFYAIFEDEELSNVSTFNKLPLKLFPNPSNNYISWQISKQAKVLVYTTDGKFIMEKYLNDNKLNINDLDIGSYIINLYIENKIYEGRFVKF